MSFLFKKSPRRKALDEEVKKAKWEGYRKGRIERARTEGRRAGKMGILTRMDRIGGALARFESASRASNRAADTLMGGLGGSGGLFGLGEQQRRKNPKKHKGKKITVYVR